MVKKHCVADFPTQTKIQGELFTIVRGFTIYIEPSSVKAVFSRLWSASLGANAYFSRKSDMQVAAKGQRAWKGARSCLIREPEASLEEGLKIIQHDPDILFLSTIGRLDACKVLSEGFDLTVVRNMKVRYEGGGRLRLADGTDEGNPEFVSVQLHLGGVQRILGFRGHFAPLGKMFELALRSVPISPDRIEALEKQEAKSRSSK